MFSGIGKSTQAIKQDNLPQGQTPAVKVRMVMKPSFRRALPRGVFAGDGQSEFTEFHGAKRFGGTLHQHAADAVALIAGEDADLRGVADAGGDFAGEDGGDEIVATGLDEGRRRRRGRIVRSRGAG